MRRITSFAFVFAALALASCTTADTSIGSYDSNAVYKRPLYSTIAKKSIAHEGVDRNPVILIHGFLGARLKDRRTNEIVWGEFTGKEVFGGSFSAKQLSSLSVPMEMGAPLRELRNDAYPISILKNVDVKILGMHFNLDAYDKMIETLEGAGYVSEDKPLPEGKHYSSLFVFYYDWRRDLIENAARLQDFIQKRRAYMQTQYKKFYGISDYNVQFDVVAHSMGGLLARYYLQYGTQDLPEDGSAPKLDWAGTKYIDKLVVVATPNAGYLDTFTELLGGLRIAPELPLYPPGVIGTFPTYYQMLPHLSTRSVVWKDDPNGKPVDIYDPEIWIKMKWGLADPKQDDALKIVLPDIRTPEQRRAVAVDHLRKCLKRARQFSEAMSVEAFPPDNTALYLFLGDAVPTSRTARVDRETGAVEVTDYEAGDGKVLASSARLDDREGRPWRKFEHSPVKWAVIYHIFAAHMGITSSQEFADNVSYYLLEATTKEQAEKRRRPLPPSPAAAGK
jgi:pimeloyl-ACP methyl ester carboxylesterase